MAGRIREDDIAEVREKVRIEEVVSSYVTLRNAGGGSLKGLCPFHDEKTPSFNVNPARNFFHCFGCQEGGDALAFVQKMDGLSFVEALERLADMVGVQLRREEGDDEPRGPRGPGRQRLVEAHTVAETFYREQLGTPEAVEARRFLDSRGFDRAAAEQFGVGFAPRDGDALLRHLRARRFTDEESVAAGLVAQGRSAYDRFRGRLLWPIRDAGGDTIGFGARRIFDDDRIDAKYLNTPETQIYKKSRVLYGLDLARKAIGLHSQAVIVEGYTDVMACQLAGVPTAIATCGTAFGEDHAKMLRRFLHDHDEFKGEVIFTFDGDEAGQRAAVKAFSLDQSFVSQTYVAVESEGRDPCDLRLAEGDEAVRELVATRAPLYRFILGNILKNYDLDRADGRVDAMREAAELVASIRDQSKVTAFAQEVSRMIGAEIDTNVVLAQVRRAAARGPETKTAPRRDRVEADAGTPEAPRREAAPRPDLRDPRFGLERETLKLVVQHPGVLGRTVDDLDADDFTHPTFRGVWEAVAACGGARAGTGDPGWATRLTEAATDPAARSAVSALGVERIPVAGDPDSSYAAAHVTKLQELTVLRRIQTLKSRLQRTNPVEQQTDYNRMFGELVALEQQRRALRDRLVTEQ